MSTELEGTCDRCPKQPVVAVNGVRACLDHLDEVMAEGFAPVREAIERQLNK